MSEHHPVLDASRESAMRARNRRTGLIMLSIAVVFFIGIIVKYSFLR